MTRTAAGTIHPNELMKLAICHAPVLSDSGWLTRDWNIESVVAVLWTRICRQEIVSSLTLLHLEYANPYPKTLTPHMSYSLT